MPTLPYVTLLFATEWIIVAAGHDCEPVLFEGDANSGWHFTRSLDDPATRSSASASPSARVGGVGRLNNDAFNRFRAQDSRGVTSGGGSGQASPPGSPIGGMGSNLTISGGSTQRTTVHHGTITSVRAYEGAPGEVSKVSTSGVDGMLIVWPIAGGLSGGMGRLGLR